MISHMTTSGFVVVPGSSPMISERINRVSNLEGHFSMLQNTHKHARDGTNPEHARIASWQYY